MTSHLPAKIDFVLKALSVDRAQLAAELRVDKATVARWVNGTAAPAPHNLSRLTRLIAARIAGFNVVDWERDLTDLSRVIGVPLPGQPSPAPMTIGDLPLQLIEESLAVTRLRGAAYEGFYRATRPYAQQPGHFIQDRFMLRVEPNGAMSAIMNSAGVIVQGWVMLLNNQLFFIGSETTSGAFVFAIFNGVSTVQAAVMDGIVLYCALDAGHTPIASRSVFERTAELSGDPGVDNARFAALDTTNAVVPEDAIDPQLRAHLVHDIGPAQLPLGGDWLLSLPLAHSMARGLNPPKPGSA
jgi:hypothetical protein